MQFLSFFLFSVRQTSEDKTFHRQMLTYFDGEYVWPMNYRNFLLKDCCLYLTLAKLLYFRYSV